MPKLHQPRSRFTTPSLLDCKDDKGNPSAFRTLYFGVESSYIIYLPVELWIAWVFVTKYEHIRAMGITLSSLFGFLHYLSSSLMSTLKPRGLGWLLKFLPKMSFKSYNKNLHTAHLMNLFCNHMIFGHGKTTSKLFLFLVKNHSIKHVTFLSSKVLARKEEKKTNLKFSMCSFPYV